MKLRFPPTRARSLPVRRVSVSRRWETRTQRSRRQGNSDTNGEFDGTGFVGKGDVQTPFGWNNATINSNAPGVTFTFATIEVRERDCQTLVGGPPPTRVLEDVTITKAVGSSLAYEQRKNSQGQLTGFILTGFEPGASVVTTVVDPPCGGQLVGANTLVDEFEGLFAHHSAVSHQIWPVVP